MTACQADNLIRRRNLAKFLVSGALALPKLRRVAGHVTGDAAAPPGCELVDGVIGGEASPHYAAAGGCCPPRLLSAAPETIAGVELELKALTFAGQNSAVPARNY